MNRSLVLVALALCVGLVGFLSLSATADVAPERSTAVTVPATQVALDFNECLCVCVSATWSIQEVLTTGSCAALVGTECWDVGPGIFTQCSQGGGAI
ncbi:MAG: hypothetical protein AAGC60_14045 [Acidobacteriota bacterium]